MPRRPNPQVADDSQVTEPVAAPAEVESSPAPSGGAGVPLEPADQAIRRLEGELDEVRDRHIRLAAEFDNYRKRMARERAELTERAQAGLAARLLDVLDDLERLLGGDHAAGSTDSVVQGMELVARKLWKELEAAGLERVDPVGQVFNPAVHEAVAVLPPPNPELDHRVSATFQPGYSFKGSLLRPARVQVYASQGQP
jgi:molecular chaperone GrpE